MGAVTGGPATGEGEGPWTTAGDQPSRHWHYSAGWLLWCCVELRIPGYIVVPVRICKNLWRHALVKFVEACPCQICGGMPLFSIIINISPLGTIEISWQL